MEPKYQTNPPVYASPYGPYGNVPPETQGDPLIGLDCSSVLAEMPRSHSEYGAWITEKLAEYSSSGEADARGPALYDLLKYTDAQVGRSITNDEDKEIAADGGLILAASAENISMTILTALFHLVRSPDLLQRLVTSVSQTTRSSGQKYERSVLLSVVIDESLRINPPVPGALFRELKADSCFDDVHIPKGTLVGVSAYVLHHDAANFGQPESFVPDRWLGNDVRCTREAFCPFGFGARDCVGKNLALDVTAWVIEHLLNRLEWRVGADDDQTQLKYEDFFVSYPARMEARVREKRD
jgi:cytochrome P450